MTRKTIVGAEAALNPPTKTQLKKITELVDYGYTQTSIANHFKISHGTWNKRKKNFPEIQSAVDAGKYSQQELVLGKYWAMIKDDKSKGHVQAVLKYMSSQMEWQQSIQLEVAESKTKKGRLKLKKVKKDE